MSTRTSTPTAIRAATRASALSTILNCDATRGAAAILGAAAVAPTAADARGAAVGAAVAPADAGAADAAGAGAAGGVGSLMVGPAVGFGGKLIRTVSFFGCTFAASGGFGGTAPDGIFKFSAILFYKRYGPHVAVSNPFPGRTKVRPSMNVGGPVENYAVCRSSASRRGALPSIGGRSSFGRATLTVRGRP